MARPELSMIIPAYNEETVVGRTLEAIARYLTELPITHELIVVDDGSRDRTVTVVRELMERIPSIRLLQSGHVGKGGAVKRGVLEAQGIHVLFMDADYSTPIQVWKQCAPWLRDGYEVVIGSRKMPGADVEIRQPPLREAMGKVFTWLTNVALGTRVTDITCGFKSFQAEAARQIFQLQRAGVGVRRRNPLHRSTAWVSNQRGSRRVEKRRDDKGAAARGCRPILQGAGSDSAGGLAGVVSPFVRTFLRI